ncbi:MAG: ECF transporter S component [Erysipelotrichales bacterium]|nr:ECF transporter S component [Erysipelotrichales bacterium]
MNNKKLYRMVVVSFFVAIELVLMVTPLGYVPIGVVRATTLHIPVILAGIILGSKAGALVGLVFGLSSLLTNTFTPSPASFLFSPFYNGGNIGSLIISILPRILIGVSSAYVYNYLKSRKNILSKTAVPISALVGSFTNTILVLLGIYVFFKDAYAAYKGVTASAVVGILLGQLSVNGVLEALLAAVLCSMTSRVLLKIIKK